MRLLEPWGCRVTVVRRSVEPFEGAVRTVTLADAHDAVAGADAVVVALALTDETRGMWWTKRCWRRWGRGAGW